MAVGTHILKVSLSCGQHPEIHVLFRLVLLQPLLAMAVAVVVVALVVVVVVQFPSHQLMFLLLDVFLV